MSEKVEIAQLGLIAGLGYLGYNMLSSTGEAVTAPFRFGADALGTLYDDYTSGLGTVYDDTLGSAFEAPATLYDDYTSGLGSVYDDYTGGLGNVYDDTLGSLW